MITMAATLTGLTPEVLAERAVAIRPALLKSMKGIMREGRSVLLRQARARLHAGTGGGETFAAIRAGKISATLRGEELIGLLRHYAFVLNIYDGGGTHPARELRPKTKTALRFVGPGGQFFFSKGHHIRATPIPALQITPAMLAYLQPVAAFRLPEVIRRVVEEGNDHAD